LAVGFESKFSSGEGGDEHDEGAAGEMEVGEESVNRLKFLGRVKEDVGRSVCGTGVIFLGAREVFEDSGDGCSDGGRKVPMPTCRVKKVWENLARVSGVKWRPAVGAAMAPSSRAKVVW